MCEKLKRSETLTTTDQMDDNIIDLETFACYAVILSGRI